MIMQNASGSVIVELRDDGIYTMTQGPYMTAAAYSTAAHVDGRHVDTLTAAATGCRRLSGTTQLGGCQRMEADYQADNGLCLTQTLELYEDGNVTVKAALWEREGNAGAAGEERCKTVTSRYLAPFVFCQVPAEAAPEVPPEYKSLGLSMLLVPYDNTMWIRYEAVPLRPGRTSHDLTVIFDPAMAGGLLVGAVDFELWKNAIAISGYDARLFTAYSGAADGATHDTCLHGAVTGSKVESARFLIRYGDSREALLENYAACINRIKPPLSWKEGVPFGWNSWSGLAFRLNEKNYEAAGDFLYEELMPASFRNQGTAYVNLDAGWNRIGEKKLMELTDRFHGRGQKAGIYAAPFAFFGRDIKEEIPEEAGHVFEEILLKDEAGRLLPRVDGAIPYDVTHPLWKSYTTKQLRNFVRWGFDYAKLDFLSHGAMEGVHCDPAVMTGRQAIAQAYALVCEELKATRQGEPFFISLSIAPLFPHGNGHARRFSCDAFGHMADTEYLLNALTHGWWQSKMLYALNDPDHTVLYQSFENGVISFKEAKARYTASVISGTVMMLSDDYGPDGDTAACEEARRRAKVLASNEAVNAVAKLGMTFRPVWNDRTGASEAYYLSADEGKYLAVFNFEEQARKVSVIPGKLGMGTVTEAQELWSGELIRMNTPEFALELPPHESRLYRLK